MQAATSQKEFGAQLLNHNDTGNQSGGDIGSKNQPSQDNVENAPNAPWRALFFFITKSNIPVLAAAITASLIAGAVSPAQSFVVGKVFDRLTSFAAGSLEKKEFLKQEKKFVVYLLVLAGIAWVSFFLSLAFWIAFGELQAKSARDRLFYGLLKKDVEWYDMRKNGITALLPRMQARIRDLQLATSQPLGTVVSALSSAILSLTQASILSWKLTLVTVSTVPLIIGVVAWIGSGMQRAFDQQGQRLSAAQKHATNALSGIEMVKCFNAQGIEQRKYTACIREAASCYYRAANANAVQLALMVLLSSSMFVQGFYFGSVLVAKGQSSTADVITTFLSAISAFQAINAVLPQLIVLERGRTAGSSLRAVMADVQRQADAQPAQDLLRPECCYGNIEVRNLTFSYPSNPQQTVVQDLSLFFAAGQTTFLIGKSGSGKSTIGQLLMRFYSSYSGRISLDGTGLDEIDIDWLRSNVTLLEQSSLLFNDTVFRNIAFGKRNNESVTKDEMAQAVEFALLQLTISDMRDGLATFVGYRGSTLSGGQRQRIALARARLRDSPILILDECTSALDHISRTLMMDAIRQWRRGKTTIIITHEILQILPDDYVYVLEHGRLAQSGYRKYIEGLSGGAFQDFLSTEQRASKTSLDAYHNMSLDISRLRAWSVDSRTKRLSEFISDPLDAHLHVMENRKATFLPRMIPDSRFYRGTTSVALVGGSPWLPISASPRLEHATSMAGSNWWNEKSPRKFKTPFGNIEKRTRMTQDVAGLVNRAGRLAAEARVAPGDVQRRRASFRRPDKSSKKRQLRPAHRTKNEGDQSSASSRSFYEIYRTLWPSINHKRKLIFALASLCSMVHAVSTPAFTFVLAKLLRLYSIPGGDSAKALTYSMIILGIAFVDSVATYTYHFSFEYVGQGWVDRIRSNAMIRILDQPRDFFNAEENGVSRLSGSLDRDAEEMRNLLGRFLALMWIVVAMSAISIVWAMITQPKMTAIALSAVPYIFGVTKAYAMVSEEWEKLCNDANQDSAAIFTEVFTNVKTVRALTLEQHFTKKYLEVTSHALALGFRRAIFAGFFYGLSDSAGNFSIAMIFFVGTRLAASEASVEHIITVFAMLIFAITNVAAILGYVPQIGSSKDTASRLLRLAHLPNNSHEHSGEARIRGVGDIAFNDLRFAYPSRPEQAVLKNLNLLIPAGVCTAIVGGSGSGKSTIANLLLRLYDTADKRLSGCNRLPDLTVAGRDIRRIDTSSLRMHVVPVSQTSTMFGGTIYDNIAYGLSRDSPYNNYSCVAAAAEQAGIHNFINSLPQGYTTSIGDGGMGLSGGQAQRIAIARALVRRPSVLILDEATSALDVESANMVRQTIERLITGRNKLEAITVIIISHSRQMMEIAEKVVVLERGTIVEEGTFQGLLKRNGALARLLSGGEWNN